MAPTKQGALQVEALFCQNSTTELITPTNHRRVTDASGYGLSEYKASARLNATIQTQDGYKKNLKLRWKGKRCSNYLRG